MRLFRGRLLPKHASIPGSAGPSMRLSRDRSAQACVYSGSGGPSMRLSGIGRPEHASMPEPVDPGMRLSRSRLTRHASMGSALCVYPGDRSAPSMRLSRSRLTRACVYSGVGWPKHASIPGSVGLSMRLSRSRLTRACVYSGVGWPKHASIPGLSMRLTRACARLAQACVYPGIPGMSRDRRPEHASRSAIPGHAG